jgi:hypothetical protein
MTDFEQIGKLMIVGGLAIIIVGLFLTFGNKIPLIGRLPGDVFIQRGNFRFYFPIVTGLILSIVLTVLANLVLKLFGR